MWSLNCFSSEKMSGEDDNGREISAEGYGLRQFVVSCSRAGLWSNSPSLDGPAPLGFQCKVIGGKVHYGSGLPRPAWMEDQLRFKLIMKEVSVKNTRLQLYGPLSAVSSDGWDGVGSSNSSGNMTDQPSNEVTSQSSKVAENFSHIASAFQYVEDLAHIRPTLRLPGPQEDYEIIPCQPSN